MKTVKLLIFLLFLVQISYSQSSDDIVIAKRIKINSAVLGEERTIIVSTPSGYAKSKNSYHVMYVMGGVSEVIGLIKYISGYIGVPEPIVVIIGDEHPARDMFPSKPKYKRGSIPAKPWYNKKEDNELRVPQPGEKVGEADKYLSFIETELFPFIEKNYHTVPYRICCGHSRAGLCVTYAFLTHTKMFNAYIALSPSLYWDDGLVMKTAEEKLSSLDLKHKVFYFNIGGDEIPSTIGDAFTFAQTIRENASSELKWKLDYLPNETHGSGTAIGIINAMKFIYDGWNFDTDKIKTGGINVIDTFYKNLSERFGYEISFDAGLLNDYGWGFIRNRKYEEAIKIFKQNTLRFPNSPDAYNHLGEGYLAADSIGMAIKSYEKAVELATSLKDDKKVTFLKSRIESIKAGKK
jgi:hypothetical protein